MFEGQYKKPQKPPTQPPLFSEDMVQIIEFSLAERVKQLILFAETADEVDALAEAYRKISSNKN